MKYEYRSTTNRRSYFLLTGERTALALGKGILTLSFLFFKTLSPPTVRMFFCFYFLEFLFWQLLIYQALRKCMGRVEPKLLGLRGRRAVSLKQTTSSYFGPPTVPFLVTYNYKHAPYIDKQMFYGVTKSSFR